VKNTAAGIFNINISFAKKVFLFNDNPVKLFTALAAQLIKKPLIIQTLLKVQYILCKTFFRHYTNLNAVA